MTICARRPGDRRRRAGPATRAMRLFATLICLSTFALPLAAHAGEDAPSPVAIAQADGLAPPPSGLVPLPDPIPRPSYEDPENPLARPGGAPGGAMQTAEPVIGGDNDALPEAVRRTRAMIMEAARNADFEALRPLIDAGATQLSFGDIDGDPIDFIRTLSGDPEGFEILAILLEVLEARYAVFDPGTPREYYVWPYFTATSLEALTPVQRVELFKLVTSGDYEDMRTFGAYIFYRAGITADGRWIFFVAGD